MNRAIRERFDWRGWTVAAAAIAIVLGLMAILSSGFRAFIAHPSTAGWAAAIATAIASGVALYMASSTMRAFRTQQRDREEIGFSVHALVTPELGLLLLKLGQIPSRVERVAIATDDANLRAAQTELSVLAESLHLASAQGVIERLHYLPANKGRIAAYIAGLLPQWHHSINLLSQVSPTSQVWDLCRRQSDAATGRLAILVCDFLGEDIDAGYYVDLRSCVQVAREEQAKAAKLIPGLRQTPH